MLLLAVTISCKEVKIIRVKISICWAGDPHFASKAQDLAINVTKLTNYRKVYESNPVDKRQVWLFL